MPRHQYSINGIHRSDHARGMCKLRAGAYGLDRREPESMDIPEVCAFSRYGLLEEIDYTCEGKLVVVRDDRFGIIPVCKFHRSLIMKVAEELQVVPQPPKNVITKIVFEGNIGLNGYGQTIDDEYIPTIITSFHNRNVRLTLEEIKETDVKDKEGIDSQS